MSSAGTDPGPSSSGSVFTATSAASSLIEVTPFSTPIPPTETLSWPTKPSSWPSDSPQPTRQAPNIFTSSSLVFGFVFFALLVVFMGCGFGCQRVLILRRAATGGHREAERQRRLLKAKPEVWDVYVDLGHGMGYSDVEKGAMSGEDDWKGKEKRVHWQTDENAHLWRDMNPLTTSTLRHIPPPPPPVAPPEPPSTPPSDLRVAWDSVVLSTREGIDFLHWLFRASPLLISYRFHPDRGGRAPPPFPTPRRPPRPGSIQHARNAELDQKEHEDDALAGDVDAAIEKADWLQVAVVIAMPQPLPPHQDRSHRPRPTSSTSAQSALQDEEYPPVLYELGISCTLLHGPANTSLPGL